MTRRWVWWLLVLCGYLATGRAAGQELPVPGEVQAMLGRSWPYLEEALGERLSAVPTVCTVAAPDLVRALQPEVEAQVRWQFPALQGEMLARAVATSSTAVDSFTLAWHTPTSGVLLVPPNVMARIRDQVPSAVVNLALVDEAACQVLERRYGVSERLAHCRDSEAYFALQAVWRGRARWITGRVAARMQLAGAYRILTEAGMAASAEPHDPGLRQMVHEVVRQRQWASNQGAAFFDYLERQGVQDAERLAFQRPPRQREWIDRPELYLRSLREARHDLAEVLSRLEKVLSAPGCRTAQRAWTPEMIREAALLLGQPDRGEKLASSWNEGRSLAWTDSTRPGRHFGVGLLRFQNDAAARGYVGLAVDAQRKQEELLAPGCAGRQRLAESRCSSPTLAGADEAVRVDKRLVLGEAGTVPVTQLWVRRGAEVAEFTWHGLPGDAAWVEQVLPFLFSQPGK